MSDFQRVKSKATGHEFSVRIPHPDKHEVLDKPATNSHGGPLPAKPKTSVATKAAEKKKTSTPGAEPATVAEEGTAS